MEYWFISGLYTFNYFINLSTRYVFLNKTLSTGMLHIVYSTELAGCMLHTCMWGHHRSRRAAVRSDHLQARSRSVRKSGSPPFRRDYGEHLIFIRRGVQKRNASQCETVTLRLTCAGLTAAVRPTDRYRPGNKGRKLTSDNGLCCLIVVTGKRFLSSSVHQVAGRSRLRSANYKPTCQSEARPCAPQV